MINRQSKTWQRRRDLYTERAWFSSATVSASIITLAG